MISVKVKGNTVGPVAVEGNLMDIVGDTCAIVHAIYKAVAESDKGSAGIPAEIFKRFISIAVSGEDSPVWKLDDDTTTEDNED